MLNLRIGSIVAALLLVGAASAYAQTTGTICGTVTDPSGAGMPGVLVALGPMAEPSATATTTTTGDYVFPNLSVGTYAVSFRLEGFKTSNHPKIVVTSGFQARVDQRMEFGSVEPELLGKGGAPMIVDTKKVAGGTFTKDIISNGPRVVPRPCAAAR